MDTDTHEKLRVATKAGERAESAPSPGAEEPTTEIGVGDCIGRYTVRRLIGTGGMGRVFEAVDPLLGRTVAIKLIQSDGEPTPRARVRLLREAQALARLKHPNVVTIYDVDVDADQVFIAMEHIRGTTLDDWRLAAQRDWRETLATFLAAGRGLAAAHAEGIVHRDFKPANVLVGEGRVVVVDFGLAVGNSEEPRPELSKRSMLHVGVTRTGEHAGTPLYMAPEQRALSTVTAKSDQYSFCIALWESLHGERPPSTVIRPEVPARINAAVQRGLEQDPDRRWPSMDELLSALAHDPVRRRRQIVAAGLLTAIALFLAFLASARGRQEVCLEPTTTIWDDSARAALRSAFVDMGVADANERFDRLDRTIQARLGRWARFHADVCAATELRHEQSAALMEARMACLARGREQIAAFVNALRSIDAKRLDEVTSRGGTVGDLEACNDARLTEVEPLPSDPRIVAEIASLEREAARVEALSRVGNIADAMAATPGLVTRARELGYQPLLGRVLYDSGELACMKIDPRTAKSDLYAALDAAVAAHDDYAAARISTRILRCVGYIDGNLAQAEPLTRAAEVAVARAGSPPELHEELYRAELGLRFRGDDYANALAYAELTLFLGERLHGAASPESARALAEVGFALSSFGAYRAAEVAYRRAISILDTSLGHDADSLWARVNLGFAEFQLGELDRARETLEDALLAASRRGLPTDPILKRIGVVYDALGRFDEALDVTRRALSEARSTRRPDHADVTFDLALLCQIALDRNDLAEASVRCDEALALRIADASRPGDIADSYLRAAELARKQHDLPKARSQIEQAIARHRAVWPRNPPVAADELELGQILLESGAAAAARPVLEDALEFETRMRNPDAPDVVRAETLLAEALIATHDLDAAASVASRAVAAVDRTVLRADIDGAARFALARSLRPDQRTRAIALARQARARLHGLRAAEEAKRIERWLASH